MQKDGKDFTIIYSLPNKATARPQLTCIAFSFYRVALSFDAFAGDSNKPNSLAQVPKASALKKILLYSILLFR